MIPNPLKIMQNIRKNNPCSRVAHILPLLQFSAKGAGIIARESDGNIVAVGALARDYVGNLRIVSKSCG